MLEDFGKLMNTLPNKIVFLVVHLFWCFSVQADINSSAEAGRELAKRLQNVSSFSSEFVQQALFADGTIIQEIEGQLLIKKPNLMRWQTKPPYEQLVVADGVDIWILDRDLEQVTVRPMQKSLQEVPALIFSSDEQALTSEYVVNQPSENIFQLLPRDNSQLFQQLLLVYERTGDEDSLQPPILKKLEIVDVSGQITRITFDQVVENLPLESNQFRFVIPDNIDVIDGR